MEPIAENPTEIRTTDSRFKAMFDAIQRIDKGAGTPDDVRTAVTNGASFYAEEAQRITGDKKPLVENDARRLKRFQEAGPYGLIGFCTDQINLLVDQAMRSYMANAPKSAVLLIQRAERWEEVLKELRRELRRTKQIDDSILENVQLW